ncbi:5-oxoprolinase subunit PxpB [Evansella cellulosilytica]|uniref:Allophanate hydrolase subunit 1 n=1 Tax=Evansella cellulosilytica (strain ATCC 21833 / DSM 2522 / FERM P-1141 / JCM 9156 / N-4) TaxID=649639 RepID=E6TY74_EVAC2|nr:5-oxoprolinase subunit PxpB [Evansella cellulosilytica]ADU32393.1 Allophanate hydrolase subunit 1 [Evansella cellulosilytica DSM 2522]
MFSYDVMPLGDKAIRVEIGKTISPEINSRVHRLASAFSTLKMKGVIELVPAYTTLTIYYNPLMISYLHLIDEIENQMNTLKSPAYLERKKVIIPVCYGGEKGPDLDYVANYHAITCEKVIEMHTKRNYLTYMVGFLPGFPYLGGMNKQLATPRKTKPRRSVAAGSVGIAGEQTGIYPIQSPGGWQIIGRTPVSLFNPTIKDPTLVKAGDYLVFKAVSETEYDTIKKAWEKGEYSPAILHERVDDL